MASPIQIDGDPHGWERPALSMLLTVVAGVSATLYGHEASSGSQFKGLLSDCYPWDLDPPAGATPRETAHILYNEFRNPFVHTLGLRIKGRHIKFGGILFGGGDADSRIEDLERSPIRPQSDPSFVRRHDATVLWLGAFYWGLRVMLERMAADPDRMAKAAAHLRGGSWSR